MNIRNILSRGRVFGVVGSTNSGKTTALFHLIEEVKKFKSKEAGLYAFFHHFAYRDRIEGVEFLSTLNELEMVENSFIFIDEFHELFKLQDRHNVEIVKAFLNQIQHNNNILVLCSTPEYYNKLVGGAIGDNFILKSLNYDELVNGSPLKKLVNKLAGDFKGGTRLNIPINKMMFRGALYDVHYNKKQDKKLENVSLFAEDNKRINKSRG